MSASLNTNGSIYIHGTVTIEAKFEVIEEENYAFLTFTDKNDKTIDVCVFDITLYDLQHAIEQALHKEDEGYSI